MGRLRPAAPRVTQRDVAILDDVRLSGVIGVEHLAELYFTGISRARRRLAALERSGHVRRLYVATGSASARSAFAIGPASADLLAERAGADRAEVARQSRRPFARMMIEHSLGVAAVRTSLGRDTGLVASFLQEPRVRHEYVLESGGKREAHAFRPDGAFLFQGPSRPLVAFLEFDRGNASLCKWQGVVASYRRYVNLGLFAGEYVDHCPAVLVVTTAGARRIGHLSKIALKAGGPPFWFSSLEGVAAGGFFASVWARQPGGPLSSLAQIAGGPA